MTRFTAFSAAFLFCIPSVAVAADKVTPQSSLTFEQHIRPLFKAYCFECHGEGEKLKGGLDLRLRRLIAQGGETGPAIQPGQREASLLIEKIAKGAMPPGKKKLSAEDVERIGRWITEGAKTAKPEPERITSGLIFTAEDRAFWSFQSIRRQVVPNVHHVEAVQTPVDAFLLQKLESRGLAFNPEADKRTLIRRATFDLHGLPPTPEEVADFLADQRSDAYERLIDRLLASPRYGERWGRHWLDVAGYADSDGYSSEDPIRPYAYKYRDYVIRSLNADKPFDQFIREQLAGDEMVKMPYQNLSAGDIDKLTATGFLRMAPDGTSLPAVDQPLARNQVVADTVKVVSSSLLGLTVGCAQCHNHRYDPIPQTDYYRLRAVLAPALDTKNWRTPAQRLLSLYTDADRAVAKRIEAEALKIDQERLKKQQAYIDQTLEKELAKLPEELRGPTRAARATPVAKQTAEQKKLLKEHPSVNVSAGSLYLYDSKAAADLKNFADQAAEIRSRKPVEDFVPVLTETPGAMPVTFVFNRGDHEQPKQAVEPGGLAILDEVDPCVIPAKDAARPTSGRRTALARWLTDGNHPLTARVLVNRVWMHHFGRGIVATPADFGYLGDRPTHPELLDWLAHDFMDHGWQLKRLHKMLMTSTAYRQTTQREAAKDRVDPDNHWLGRMPVRRLEAEALRDAILAVSGKLNAKAFGGAVPVRVDEVGQVVIGVDTNDTAGRPTKKVVPLHGEEFRRSIYVQVRRSKPLTMFETFDAPILEPNCEIRNASTIAPQALMLMNSPFLVEQAEVFADRIRQEAGDNVRSQIIRAWQLAFASDPTEREINDALAFLSTPVEKAGAKPLAIFCHALLGTNRFLYVD